MARFRFGPMRWTKPMRWIKVAIWLAALLPLLILVDRIFLFGRFSGGGFVDDPVELIQHWTGTGALVILFVTLSITPLRRLSGYNKLTTLRRPIGLFAFFYATLHVLSYFVFDHRLNFGAILQDVAEHNWVLVGFAAWVLLIPMAVTSTSGWIRRMGGKKWTRLHRLIYAVAVLGVLHFLWQVKLETSEPLIYGAILLVIFAVRFLTRKKKLSRPA